MDTLAHLTVDEKILLAITVIVAVLVFVSRANLGRHQNKAQTNHSTRPIPHVIPPANRMVLRTQHSPDLIATHRNQTDKSLRRARFHIPAWGDDWPELGWT